MVRANLLALSAAALIAVVTLSPPASAGTFIIASGCDTLSTQPLRILDRFKMFDRSFTTFCSVQIAPRSVAGSRVVPIRGCVATSNLSCGLDSLSGVATFSTTPCVGTGWSYGYTDSIGVIVDSANACFRVTLYVEGGPYNFNDICYTMACSSDPTPTMPETWGRLKATYR